MRMDSYQRAPGVFQNWQDPWDFWRNWLERGWDLVKSKGVFQSWEAGWGLVTLQSFQALHQHWRRSMVVRLRSKGKILWLKAPCGSDMRKTIWADAYLLRKHWNWDVLLIPWYFVSSSELRHNLDEVEEITNGRTLFPTTVVERIRQEN